MTLIEALRTGRRIRNIYYLEFSEWRFLVDLPRLVLVPILAAIDDRWEVEPDPKEELEVKRQKLRAIVSTSVNRHRNYFGMAVMPFNDLEWMRDQLIKAWGEE